MSTATTVVNTSNMMQTNYDTSKLLLGGNKDRVVTYTNPTGSPITLVSGQLMGMIGATQKVLPLLAAAVDGSQFPVGILINDRTVAGSATVTLSICTAGDVAREKVVLNGGNTFATLVDLKSIEDRIAGDTVGIVLITGRELTGFDN